MMFGAEDEQEQEAPPREKKLVSGFDPAIWASILGAQGADIMSTKFAMNRGMKEGNPLFGTQHLGKIAATKLGLGSALSFGASKLRESNPKLSKAMQILGIASGAIPATINFSRASKK